MSKNQKANQQHKNILIYDGWTFKFHTVKELEKIMIEKIKGR